MPAINVNPTRQELTRLKTRLRTSIRGHKLLKDKRDELMKQFMDVVRENRALRKRVEEGLMRAHGSFTVASALMSIYLASGQSIMMLQDLRFADAARRPPLNCFKQAISP